VYLVKAFVGPGITGAFTPLITACVEEKIRQLLIAKSSCFVTTNVSNFTFQYVRVTLDLVVDEGNDTNEIAAQVAQQLDIFLSPWISSGQLQATIDTPITAIQVADFVAGINGVLEVSDVSLQTWKDPAKDVSTVPSKKEVKPFHPYMLMVSGLDHNITCKTS
jgi:hypothetical protein